MNCIFTPCSFELDFSMAHRYLLRRQFIQIRQRESLLFSRVRAYRVAGQARDFSNREFCQSSSGSTMASASHHRSASAPSESSTGEMTFLRSPTVTSPPALGSHSATMAGIRNPTRVSQTSSAIFPKLFSPADTTATGDLGDARTWQNLPTNSPFVSCSRSNLLSDLSHSFTTVLPKTNCDRLSAKLRRRRSCESPEPASRKMKFPCEWSPDGEGSSSSSDWPSSSSDEDEHVSSSLSSKSETRGCWAARGLLFGNLRAGSLTTRRISVPKQASVARKMALHLQTSKASETNASWDHDRDRIWERKGGSCKRFISWKTRGFEEEKGMNSRWVCEGERKREGDETGSCGDFIKKVRNERTDG